MERSELEAPTRRELADAVNQWEKKAGKFFILAEREKDPLGQKFYQSSAVAYANCANDIRQLLENGIKKACQTIADSRTRVVAPSTPQRPSAHPCP